MKKWIAWSLTLLLLVTVFQASAFAVPENEAVQQNGLSIDLKEVPNGEYVIYIKDGDEWKEKGALPFSKDQSTQKLDLSGSLADKGPVAVKVAQRGGGAGNIDSVLLGGKAPVSVGGDTGVELNKLSETDFDVVSVGEEGIELVFANDGVNKELSITARIESKEISKVPFQFPSANNYKKIGADSSFYKYTLGNNTGSIRIDGDVDNAVTGMTPFFKEFCEPGTGHPNGFVYCWVMNDDNNLYVTMDVTPDNTYDGDKDYSKVYVRTAQGVKEFYLSVPENKWGLAGFTYTDKVKYQHKVYEFKIPLSEIGADKAVAGNILDLAFSAYGTMALNGLRVEPQNIILKVGEEVEIFAKLYNNSYTGDDVTSDCSFASNDTAVATVRKEGGRAYVTGVSGGSTQITAFSKDMTATPATVTVIDGPSLLFEPDTYTVDPGEEVDTHLMLRNYFTYNVELPDETFQSVLSFSTSDWKVATVDPISGVVTGVSPGFAHITATFHVTEGGDFDGNPITLTATAQVIVTGELEPELKFSPDNYRVNVKKTVQTYLKLHNFDEQSEINLPGEYASWLTYESRNPDIATIDNAGKVTGKKAGTATIIAHFERPYYNSYDISAIPESISLDAEATVTVRTSSSSASISAPVPVAETNVDSKILKTYYRGDISTSNGTYAFDAKESGDIAALWISGDYFKEIKGLYPDGMIQFNWVDATYSLPLKCIDIEAALKDNNSSKVFIKIEKVKDAAIISAAQSAISKSKANMTWGLFDFSVYIDANGQKIKDIKNYDCYVSRSLIGIGPFDTKDTTVMKYLPDLGKFTFSPSIFETVDGSNVTTAKYRGNGIFTVVKNPCTYDDIAGHWAELNIERLASRLITFGRQDNLFKPEEKVTRAEFAVMLARALAITEEKGTAEYGDISSQWFAEEIGSAAGAGLLGNISGDKFRPDDYILRGDMSIMICNALEFTGIKAEEPDIAGALSKFKDAAEIGDNIKKYAAVCARTGIIVGRNTGEFAPDENATRAEAVAIIERMLRYLKFIN